MTNEAGAVLERTHWAPYGAAVGKPNYDGIGYTGHRQDGATGLVYMQQRYYDSEVGRFLSVDPVTAYDLPIAGFNRYRYAANNPYRFTDPDGRQERAYGAGASLMLTPEQRKVWEAGERAATTEGSRSLEGAAMMDGVKTFAAEPRVTKEAVATLATVVVMARVTRGKSGAGPMHGPSPKINLGQQGKHQVGHNNYQPGRSILTANPAELGRHAGAGQQVNNIPVGLPGSRERVNFGQEIGTTIDRAGNSSPKKNGIIHYGSNGINIVPSRPDP
ncbi:polymorphic toxin type 50 domain-containing protein [Luteimonas sp. S4-F44]|uniref:RHS repeat-associated core domain-containing protein n=1 Tax=Luteimonas sp. S4-F44 TaxID=2925842 RepID=UPI001F53E250|nr:RHS repeat-associated core domain-containing protein [Luteimonas sp. S4-F44]UNK42125.1 polymorphic toxin type 50 domain-containing protein [Luteimonas sp. S4-F44]